MKASTAKRIKRALPALIIAALLAALMTAALVPSARAAGESASRGAAETCVNADALQTLSAAEAYASGHAFTTETTGVIKARVFGIPYSQSVRGGRTVSGDDFTDIAESKSALVKAAVKRSADGGVYGVAMGEYKKKSFVYGKAKKYDRAEYVALYGKPATGLVKYETDGAITETRKNADGSYTFVLDPHRATVYSRNEIKTTIGSKKYPDYESVEFTLYCDGDRPTKVTVMEKFRVDKFGGAHCTAEYTETFEFE